MCLLIETIKILGGQFQNLALHNERMNAARRELFGCNDKLDLAGSVTVPTGLRNGIYKCTVTYSQTIGTAEFNPYSIRNIKCLKTVHCNTIDYTYKYADRQILSSLSEQRGNCDEILIIKNGLLTDTSFSNLIFYDGDKWVTPKNPLLKGTKREKLLREGLITEADLCFKDLVHFSKTCLINSMLEIGDITVDCRNIIA